MHFNQKSGGKVNSQNIDWLLEGPEWLKYAVEKQFLENEIDPKPAISDKAIQQLIQVLKSDDRGFNALIKGEVSYTGDLYWYLFFLADIGFSAADLNLEPEFEKVLNLEDSHHRFVVSKEMKPDYFCISSILLTAIVRMLPETKEKLNSHLSVVMDSQRLDGGWHCAKSRAVGRKLEKTESCLMDNLNILMLLSEYYEYLKDPGLEGAIDLILEHWRRREEKWRPYGFGIGSEFKKLRYPAFKYGILRVLDVLSRYPYATKQSEFIEMFEFVKQKAEDGKLKAESVAKFFKGFDFGQRKTPSRWITFLVKRIERRIKQAQTDNT